MQFYVREGGSKLEYPEKTHDKHSKTQYHTIDTKIYHLEGGSNLHYPSNLVMFT